MEINSLFETTRKFWEEETVRGKLVYPDEQVIRFIKKNADKDDTILDFGCGYGRHAISLGLENYKNIIAMDYNRPNLLHIEEVAKKNNLNIKCIQNSGLKIPLEENSVDIVIAHASLFYSQQSGLERLLSNLSNVMKTNALMWCNFRTPEDDLIKKGLEADKNFYVVKFKNSDAKVGYFSSFSRSSCTFAAGALLTNFSLFSMPLERAISLFRRVSSFVRRSFSCSKSISSSSGT